MRHAAGAGQFTAGTVGTPRRPRLWTVGMSGPDVCAAA